MPPQMTSAQVRTKLVDALKLDLVGPGEQLGNPAEILPQSPSRWYLTVSWHPSEPSSNNAATRMPMTRWMGQGRPARMTTPRPNPPLLRNSAFSRVPSGSAFCSPRKPTGLPFTSRGGITAGSRTRKDPSDGSECPMIGPYQSIWISCPSYAKRHTKSKSRKATVSFSPSLFNPSGSSFRNPHCRPAHAPSLSFW